MHRFPGHLIIFVLMMAACTSTSKKQALLHGEHIAPPSPEHVNKYLQAQKSGAPSEESCRLWLELSRDEKFPLKAVAETRALEVCTVDTEAFPPMAEILEVGTTLPWLSELRTQAALQHAVRQKDKAWEMRLSAKVADQMELQHERIAHLERALALATELEDTARVQEYKEKLEAIAPRRISDPKPEQYLAVARDFQRVRQFRKARSYYRKILADNNFADTEKLTALSGIRKTYKLEKAKSSYVKSTRDHAAFAKKKFLDRARKQGDTSLYSLYFDSQITLARTVWTENSPREARKILKNLERDVKGRFPTEESVLIRARIEEEAGRFQQTIRLLRDIDISAVRNQELRSKIQWQLAWNLRKTDQWNEAIPLFEKLSVDETSPSHLARARYWLARTLGDAGQTQGAHDEYKWLVENDPLGYYGLLAYRGLKMKIPSIKAMTSGQLAEKTLAEGERLQAEWLIAVGERELARQFLDHVGDQRGKALSADQALEYLQLYARAGSYQSLFSRLYRLPAEVKKDVIESNAQLLFPQPWGPLVNEASRRFNVPAELIYSIMRQESAFNPKARSHADAFGLLQLIPQMAKKAQSSSGIELSSHEDLYFPEKNIPLGTSFLRSLLDRWNDQFILAVASYNASERAILGWLRTRYDEDPLQFIEDIPYEETRTYVKLVLRNFVFYSRLNSQESAIEFPEWCLENLQQIKL